VLRSIADTLVLDSRTIPRIKARPVRTCKGKWALHTCKVIDTQRNEVALDLGLTLHIDSALSIYAIHRWPSLAAWQCRSSYLVFSHSFKSPLAIATPSQPPQIPRSNLLPRRQQRLDSHIRQSIPLSRDAKLSNHLRRLLPPNCQNSHNDFLAVDPNFRPDFQLWTIGS